MAVIKELTLLISVLPDSSSRRNGRSFRNEMQENKKSLIRLVADKQKADSSRAMRCVDESKEIRGSQSSLREF